MTSPLPANSPPEAVHQEVTTDLGDSARGMPPLQSDYLVNTH
jgi:hypothetical protein